MRIGTVTCLTVLLLLLAAPAARAGCPVSAEISIVPEAPTAADEVTVTVEGVASNTCVPELLGWSEGPEIAIHAWRGDGGCFATPFPYTLEVPLGRLDPGPYRVELRLIDEPDCDYPEIVVEVLPAGGAEYSLALEPALPVVGEPIVARFSGALAPCPGMFLLEVEGPVITLLFDDECDVIPIGAGPFTLEELLPPLAAGVYRVRVERGNGELLAERELLVVEPTELALGAGERFIARVRFATRSSAGEGRAVKRTRDSGHFWFFAPDNVELTVKLIDACRDFGRFWVFAAGMTDVGLELTVEDRSTGEVRTYDNELGTPVAPILDTAAFAGCPEAAP